MNIYIFVLVRLDWLEPVDEETIEEYLLDSATKQAPKKHIKDDPETEAKKKKI